MRLSAGAVVAGILLSLAAGASSAETPAAEWTRFRGPDGAGISPATTIPVKWTEKDFNWKVKLPAEGHSSPVVWGDRLFVTCGDRETAQRIILCLKTSDGSTVWERRYDSAKHVVNPANSYAASTPAVDADHLYVYWTTRDEITLLALDHSGKEVWRRTFGEFISEHGSGASPIVFGDLVVLPNDQEGNSSILAVDRKTGQTRWTLPRTTAKAAYGTPAVYRPEGGPPELILTSNGHGVTSLDPKTGQVNWELKDAFSLRTVNSPVVASGLIVGTCGVGGDAKRLVAVQPGSKKDAQEPKLVWEQAKSIPYVPTPIARGDLLFLWTDNGVVRCLRSATGEQAWEARLQDLFYSSPVCADGRLYCVSRKGTCYVIAASEKYELLATNPLGEGSHATPAITGGVLYLRTFNHLISLGGKK
jgi:outer membrane protein assembly factor BamB